MIATLSGRLKVREAGRLVVETGGIGYEIFVPLSTYYQMPPVNGPVELKIRHVVREDAIVLYGFATIAEKYAFDLLMRVQHVGPKLALAILSVLSPDELVAAINHEDVNRIDAVPGVGPKVAERVVRELRDRIAELKLVAPAHGELDGSRNGGGSLLDDAVSALINLGYKPAEAKRAVEWAGVADEDLQQDSLETVIRKSLAVLLGEK